MTSTTCPWAAFMAAPRFSRPRRPREPGYDIIDPRDGTWIDCFSTLQEARDEVAFLESTEVKPYKQAGVKLVIRKV